MKGRIFQYMVLAAVLAVVIAGGAKIGAGEIKPTVICTTTVLGTFAREIAEERAEIVSLVQPGICPAHFDIRPSDVAVVSKASLVLYHGVEPWLESLIRASGNTEVKMVKVKGEWGAPDFAIQKVRLIQEVLSEVSPENISYFEENANKTCQGINKVARAIKKEGEELEISKIKVICMAWQSSYVKWLGFNIVATYKPPERMSMKEVIGLAITAEKEGVELVIDNLQSGTKLGSEIASGLEVSHVVLTNFPGAVPGTETYSKMIGYNARQLFSAVKSQRVSSGKQES